MKTFKGNKLSLYFCNEVITQTELENFLIKEIDDCVHDKDNLLICYPNSKFILPIVIYSVLKNEMENFCEKSNPTRRTTVLLITNNKGIIDTLKSIEIKVEDIFEVCKLQHQWLMENNIFCNIDEPYYANLYWRHIFGNYYENKIPETIPIDYYLPISTGYHSFSQLSRGKMNKIGRKDNCQESVFLITNNLNVLNMEGLLFDYVFIDFSTINKPISNIPKGTLFFLDNLLDDRLVFLNKFSNKKYFIDRKILEFYPEKDMKVKTPFSRPNSEMILDLNFSNLTIEYVVTDFEDELAEAFVLLRKLTYKNFDQYDLKLLRILLNNIIKIPVEGVTYDLVTKYDPLFETINDLLKELKESDNRFEDNDFENIIKCIENIYNKFNLDIYCPKYVALESLILKEKEANNTIGIISSSKIGNIALKEKLANLFQIEIDGLEEQDIKFYNKKKLINKQEKVESDILVMLTATKISDFKTIISGRQKKTVAFLYNLEITELRNKFGQLKDMSNSALNLLEKENWELVHNNNVYKYFYNKLRKCKSRELIEIDNDLSLTEMAINISIDNYMLGKRKIKNYEGNGAVPAILINFDGGGGLFLRLNSKVQFLNKRQKKIEIKNTSELNIGEEIILINNDSRQDLYNLFIKSIEEINQSVIYYNIIESWREKYEDKYVSLKMDDNSLYKKLKELGWDKTTKAVLHNWRSGYSFGPRDIKDIVLLGKALGIKDFIEKSEEYFESMSKIRVERRVAAKILNKIIYYSNKKIDDNDLKFLKNYNLSLDEVREALKIRKIVDISDQVYKVKPSEIGILHE